MKKLISLLLTLLLLLQLLSGLGLSAAAAAPTPTTEVEDYILGQYKVTTVPDDAVAIRSAAEFGSMNANGTYYLDADITVLSTYSATFGGNLYGNGHTVTIAGNRPVFGTLQDAGIYDVTIVGTVSTDADYVGALAAKAYGTLLVGIANECDVHNSRWGKFAGGIVGYAEDTILRYCTNKGALTGHKSETRLGGLVGQMDNAAGKLELEHCINYGSVTGVNQTGGLVGRVQNGKSVSFTACANFGTVSVSYSDGGGIIGKITSPQTEVSFRHCYNSALINGATFTGGFVGILEASSLLMVECHNGCYVKSCQCGGSEHGKITNKDGSGDQVPIGGLIGQMWRVDCPVTMESCTNRGDIVAGGKWRAGGLAAVMECAQITVTDCHNYGDITSTYYVGGLFGRVGAAGTETLKGDVLLKNCSNSGKIKTTSYGGGFVGYQEYATTFTVENCTNSGDVETGWNAGGFIARADSGHTECTMSFTDCTNSGNITAKGTAGGLTGIFTGADSKIKSLTFTRCTNTGDVTAPNYAGGMSGIADVGAYTATECRNDGDMNIVNQNENGDVGGITGRAYGVTTFTSCINTGNIIESRSYGKGTAYNLYVGGIAGWVGRGGADYKHQYSKFSGCINTGVIVAKEALSENQLITAGGIVGCSRSNIYADHCMTTGAVNGTCEVAGIAGTNGSNGVGGSEFSHCVMAADLYNNGARVTSRSHGAGGIACYVWGDVHVFDCVVMGDITLNVNGSELTKDQRRPVSAMVGYTNNGGGEFKNNFFGGKLTGGEGTDCIVVMLAFTVEADVSGDEGGDILDNYSYYQYPLHYCSKKEYSQSTTPVLTEEQIAAGISFADIVAEPNPNLEVIRLCTGIEVPILSFMRANYEWGLSMSGGHGYVTGCDATCPTCGKTRVAFEHHYMHACDASCNACGAIREVGEHELSNWVVVTPATETEKGLRKAYCDICGAEETREIPLVVSNTPAEGENGTTDGAGQGNTDDLVTDDSTTLIIIVAAAGGAAVLIILVVILVISKSKKKKKIAIDPKPEA